MLVNLNVREFVNETASNSPVPGGGSIAALAGALGVALATMVANLTVGKEKYAEVEAEMQEVIKKGDAIKAELLDLIDRDATSFDGVMQAFKMPKETDEEKAARTEKIQSEYKYAASVPMQTAELAMQIMDLAEVVVEKGNPNAVTDGAVAAMMSRTAVLSALLNVKINIGSIKDEAFVAEMKEKIATLEKKSQAREAEVLAKVKL
ncbi:MAG: cyclodeaminase/cyclohydrolase family protein [Clostridia bacterium]|nr:cyclodeaminase/cyclohydrolase family protein [Clostridia bacterium]